MMNDWYYRAEMELEEALERGEITYKEYQREIRDLRRELEMQAQEAADEAYNNAMGGW